MRAAEAMGRPFNASAGAGQSTGSDWPFADHVSGRRIAADEEFRAATAGDRAADASRAAPDHLRVMADRAPVVVPGHVGEHARAEIAFLVGPELDHLFGR